jgi:hypothetical protein
MKKYLIVVMLVLLTACESPPVRRQELVSMHPEWSTDMVTLIQNGYLAKGMTGDQVSAAWGKPCQSCIGTKKGEWGEAWEYATQLVFFDKNGNVTRWTNK